MPVGFLYVLINPSMPGLAKVGKTTRNPTDRMAELSSATGVPSPFMLAFQQPVAECDSAELWVHRELERVGFRHADNREFFNGPLHEIIQVVAQAANLVVDEANLNRDSNDGSPIYKGRLDATIEAAALATELFNLALAHRDGTDVVLRNERKALEYFEQAAALGDELACFLAAEIYRRGGDGIKPDIEKAFTLYSKAVRLGGWHNEAGIAELFLEAKQEGAAQAHWKSFFERACKEFDAWETWEEERREGIIGAAGFSYCSRVVRGELTHCVPDYAVARLAEPILAFIGTLFSTFTQDPDKEFAELGVKRLLSVRQFVEGKMTLSVEQPL